MDYTKVTLYQPGAEKRDMLVALLSGVGYEGFEEKNGDLLAYIPEDQFLQSDLDEVAGWFQVPCIVEVVKEQNWNELWESNFDPVVVEEFCTVRAAFHHITVATPYEVVITPKMSFGTGHHATTRLMIKIMQSLDFANKSVLDFGSGTGVLAILAEKLGASRVLAIDNDDWAINNATENVQTNDSRTTEVRKATLSEVVSEKFDVILANINRHILVDNMALIGQRLAIGGTLVMSGLLAEDQAIITVAAADASLVVERMEELNGWIVLLVKRL